MRLMKYNNRNNLLWNDLFNSFFHTDNSELFEKEFSPESNIIENDKEYKLELALPGFEKDQVKINLDDDVLEISASIEKKEEVNEGGFRTKEFSVRSFSKKFVLPENGVKTDKIEGKMKNGILSVVLPKLEETPKLTKNIDIK